MFKQGSNSYGTFDKKMFTVLQIRNILDKNVKDTQGA